MVESTLLANQAGSDCDCGGLFAANGDIALIKVAVVGAGLSGLVAATNLHGHDVTVFEKSRGPGGRLSTRYADPYRFDHGAQFFTARSPAFQRFVASLIGAGVVAGWSPLLADIDGDGITMSDPWSGNPHFVAVPGMNCLGQYLAANLNLMRQAEVKAIHRDRAKWNLKLADGTSAGPFDWVIAATPPAQADGLIGHYFERTTLVKCQMQACFALMIGLDEQPRLPWQAARVHNSPIAWICQNNSKPGRAKVPAVVVHADNDWSDRHVDDDQAEVRYVLLEEASRLIGVDVSRARHVALHRWRYAKARIGSNIGFLLNQKNKLAACGDWCMDGRIEGAFNSGLQLAQSISPASSD